MGSCNCSEQPNNMLDHKLKPNNIPINHNAFKLSNSKSTKDEIISFALNKSGTKITTSEISTDLVLTIYNTEDLSLHKSLKPCQDISQTLKFSPTDLNTLISGHDTKQLMIWNIESEKPLVIAQEFVDDMIQVVCYSPNGDIIVIGSADKSITIIENAKVKQKLEDHTKAVSALAFAPDSKQFASGSEDTLIMFWKLNPNDQSEFILDESVDAHQNGVLCLEFNPQIETKVLISGGKDNLVIIWNYQTKEKVHTLEEHAFWVSSLAFSPNGDIFASGSQDNTVKIWGTDDKLQQSYQTLTDATDHINSVVFSLDGNSLYTGSADKTIRVYKNNN